MDTYTRQIVQELRNAGLANDEELHQVEEALAS